MGEKKTIKCFCCEKPAWVRAKDAENVRVPFCSDCFVEVCLIGDDSVSYALQGLQLQSRSRYEELGIPMAKDAQ